MPAEEFETRVRLSDDVCVVDDEHHFVRCLLELPIHGSDQPFVWSVWCSFSRESYLRLQSLWTLPERDTDGCFGWLCTSLPGYGEATLHLPADVAFGPPGEAPTVHLHDGPHELVREQRDGIDRARVRALVEHLLHPEG